MSDIGLVGFGIVLGLSLCVPPGPMNALIAARSSVSWRAGTATGLGALTADAILGVIVFSFQSSVDLSAFIRPIYALGSVVMVVLAVIILRSREAGVARPAAPWAAYSQGVLTGLSNPFQIIWWLTAGIAFAYVGGAPLFAGLFAAIVLWVTLFPWAIRSGTERYPSIEPWVRYISVGLMLVFAGYFAYLAVAPSL